jgi:putative colanic acid biosynthesis glycosyltransferase
MTGQHAGEGAAIEHVTRAVKFSIVTVVLNNRDGLERTAKSVVAQRDAEYEWIVIDGGSTDGTLDVINAYRGSIAYWHSESDGGIYDAMNKGLARASADYVVFLNSGDFFAGGGSLNVVAQAVAHLPRLPAMILGGAIYEYPYGRRLIREPRTVEKYIRHSNPASHQATFFYRSLHQQIPYDTTYRIAGDYDCICRVFLRDQSCSYIDDVVIGAAHGGNSFSHRHPWLHARECIHIQRNVLRMGYGSVLSSSIRRMRSYVAEYLMSRRRLAALTWPIIRAVRGTAD